MSTTFYGDIMQNPGIHFVFDKIYSSRSEMEEGCSEDGVFHNRYVLIDYGSTDPLSSVVGENAASDVYKYGTTYNHSIWQKVWKQTGEENTAKEQYIMIGSLDCRMPLELDYMLQAPSLEASVRQQFWNPLPENADTENPLVFSTAILGIPAAWKIDNDVLLDTPTVDGWNQPEIRKTQEYEDGTKSYNSIAQFTQHPSTSKYPLIDPETHTFQRGENKEIIKAEQDDTQQLELTLPAIDYIIQKLWDICYPVTEDGTARDTTIESAESEIVPFSLLKTYNSEGKNTLVGTMRIVLGLLGDDEEAIGRDTLYGIYNYFHNAVQITSDASVGKGIQWLWDHSKEVNVLTQTT